MPHILLVDDEPRILRVLATLLKSRKYEVTTAESGEAARDLIMDKEFDLMMSDIKMKEMDGIELLRIAHTKRPAMPVVLLTAYRSPRTALDALKLGAFDYVSKPLQVDDFLATVENALKYQAENTVGFFALAEVEIVYGFEGIVSASPAMQQACAMIRRIAPIGGGTALIWGETGTGKKLIARTIHQNGPRKEEPFLTLNCAELPEPMLDLELFGGGMMAAAGKKHGLIGAARSGTLCLDEIGSLPVGTQEKLLKVIRDTKIVTPEGKSIEVHTQFVGINNTNLAPLVERGHFLHDLAACFGAYAIQLPPLRKRREDILPLIVHDMLLTIKDPAALPPMAREAKEILVRYSWPGNIEEMKLACTHMLAHIEDGHITKKSLPDAIAHALAPTGNGTARPEGQDVRAKALKAFLRDHIKNIGPTKPEP